MVTIFTSIEYIKRKSRKRKIIFIYPSQYHKKDASQVSSFKLETEVNIKPISTNQTQ